MIENFEVPYKHKPRLCKNFALPDFPAIFFEVFGEKPHQIIPPTPPHPDKAARAGLPAMAFRNNRSGVGHSRRPRPPVLSVFSGSCRWYGGCSQSGRRADQRSLWLCAGSDRPGGLSVEVERLVSSFWY